MTSILGLSSYAYFWRMSDRLPSPMSLDDALLDAADHGIRLFQICDHPPLAAAPDERLDVIRQLADSLDIRLEIGTRGTDPEHLTRFLHIAERLEATLVRSMWTSGDDRPDAAETERRLRSVLPAYERAGVTLALETYEQVPSADLVAIVVAIQSANLGICLDPANTVANLELPEDVVARCAPYVKNWHVKDFDFTRSAGWVGFQYTGVPFGTGRLDYTCIRDTIAAVENNINRIIEFWLPWQDGTANTSAADVTAAVEADWVHKTVQQLRDAA